MRRLVARRRALRQQVHALAKARRQLYPHLVPEVGGEGVFVLGLLRGARQVHHHAGERAIAVEGIEQVDAVVLVAFDVAESGGVRLPVHAGGAVQIAGAAIMPHHRVPEAAGDGPRRAGVPRRRRRLGDARDEEGEHLIGRHDLRTLRRLVMGVGEHRPGMRVCGHQHEPHAVECRQQRCQPLAHRRHQRLRDKGEVAGDEQHPLAAGFQRQRRGGQGILHPLRNTHVHLSLQHHRLFRRDAGLRPADG
ncbi:MAG: hypothetical protein BWY76_00865 [bacterium ADurb.Bin429]|nr:MAG: hypothetical protein BWY76_00865 [bacterium ADurb.Bin429]